MTTASYRLKSEKSHDKLGLRSPETSYSGARNLWRAGPSSLTDAALIGSRGCDEAAILRANPLSRMLASLISLL